MRNFCFYLLCAFFPFILVGCESKEDSYPPISYGYHLAFIDEKGNDLIDGIGTSSDSSKRLMLREKDYSYKLVKPGVKDDFTAPRYIYVGNVDGYTVLEIVDMLWEGYRYDRKPEELTRTLVCPSIFGDEKEHSIISYWKYEDNYGSAELIRITIDGVDARIEVGANKYQPLVIATLKK